MDSELIYDKPFIELIGKSREEQDRDFREYIEPYATPGCKYCHGTGKEHWITELEQYKPCDCVLRNINKEQIDFN